jgi:hypothetical protein
MAINDIDGTTAATPIKVTTPLATTNSSSSGTQALNWLFGGPTNSSDQQEKSLLTLEKAGVREEGITLREAFLSHRRERYPLMATWQILRPKFEYALRVTVLAARKLPVKESVS